MGGMEEEQCAVRAHVDLMSTCFTHQRQPTSRLFPSQNARAPSQVLEISVLHILASLRVFDNLAGDS